MDFRYIAQHTNLFEIHTSRRVERILEVGYIPVKFYQLDFQFCTVTLRTFCAVTCIASVFIMCRIASEIFKANKSCLLVCIEEMSNSNPFNLTLEVNNTFCLRDHDLARESHKHRTGFRKM